MEITFGERCFVMTKPTPKKMEAFIRRKIRGLPNITIVNEWHGIPNAKQIMQVYAWQTQKPFFPSKIKYMTSGRISAYVLEGPTVISDAHDLKLLLRSRFVPGEMQRNLMHSSDNEKEAGEEMQAFFPSYMT